MPRKKNPRAGYVKPDFHSHNKKKHRDEAVHKKVRLRSSIDIYNRLMHDGGLGLDLDSVYIGYSDGKLGPQTMQIRYWVMIADGGDIPMHHIQYFAYIAPNNASTSQLLLWDRATRLDRLFGSGLTSEKQLLKHTDIHKPLETQIATITAHTIEAVTVTEVDESTPIIVNRADLMRDMLSLIGSCISTMTKSIQRNTQLEPAIFAIAKNKLSTSSINVMYDMETGDPDDLFAVLFLLSHPRVQLRAITITPGTPGQVGAVKNLLYNKLNLAANSIAIGSANPKHKKECMPSSGVWQRVCGPFDLQQPDGFGCDIIHNTLKAYGDCVIVTGAPLTNLYHYVRKYCFDTAGRVAKLTWVCQGGFAGDNVVPEALRLKKFSGKEFCATWNFNGNVEASKYLLLDPHCQQVFDKRFLVSKNVCHGVSYNEQFHERLNEFLEANKSDGRREPLGVVYEAMDIYLKKKNHGKKMHDVLAAVAAVNREVVSFRQVEMQTRKHKKVGLEWGSQLCDTSNIFISVGYDKAAFFDTFVGRASV